MEREMVLTHELTWPVEEVWEALTTQEALSEWFLPGTFTAEAGRRWEIRGKPSEGWDGRLFGEILEVDRPRRLVYTFCSNLMDRPTTVTWTLAPKGEGGTLLTLTHEGFDEQVSRAAVLWERTSAGWDRHLKMLVAHLGWRAGAR